MKNLLYKEVKLSSNPITYFFILFGFMAMIPGYPILLGSFFVCLGIFQSFQSSRENNDVLYTVLLPVKKSDAVKAKFIFTCFIQLCSFVLSFVLTILRMTLFKDSPVYLSNVMMNANQLYLAFVLVVFGIFNIVFVKPFFKTAYKLGKGFIVFIVLSFVVIGISEALHHIPGFERLNNTDTLNNIHLWFVFIAGVVFYILSTLLAEKKAEKLFNKVDM